MICIHKQRTGKADLHTLRKGDKADNGNSNQGGSQQKHKQNKHDTAEKLRYEVIVFINTGINGRQIAG